MKNQIQYFELSDFQHIYLEDSFVLGIEESSSKLSFKMEFVLTEKHPLYHKPIENEQYCYKKGEIIFSKTEKIKWNQKSFKNLSMDSTGEPDMGNIDGFYIENDIYHLNGDWGDVEVSSEIPKIVLEM